MDTNIKELINLYNNLQLERFIEADNCNIYHYTSPVVLNEILNRHMLRLTDKQYLNDKTEGIYVLDKCIQMISDKEDEFSKKLIKFCSDRKTNTNDRNFFVYQISFSCDEDNLSLWNYYTRGDSIKGYNIKFNSKELEKGLILYSNMESGNIPKIYGGKVIYEEEKQQQIIDQLIKMFKNEYQKLKIKDDIVFDFLVDKIIMVGNFFKPKVFLIENEYRIVVDLYIESNGQILTIKNPQGTFERNGFMIPYVDIEFDPSCFRGITISPTLDDDKIIENVLRLAKYKNSSIKKEDIKKSSIPVRY